MPVTQIDAKGLLSEDEQEVILAFRRALELKKSRLDVFILGGQKARLLVTAYNHGRALRLTSLSPLSRRHAVRKVADPRTRRDRHPRPAPTAHGHHSAAVPGRPHHRHPGLCPHPLPPLSRRDCPHISKSPHPLSALRLRPTTPEPSGSHAGHDHRHLPEVARNSPEL